MTGVVYPLASVMPELPETRVQLMKASMPTLPIMPVNLFSQGNDNKWDTFRYERPDYYIHNYPEILDLKVNAISGRYDLVGVTNWRSTPAVRTLDLASKLHLDPKLQYVAFDFWNQALAGVFEKEMKLEVGPHDTRVLAIHPLQGHPQLIGNSRHISGAFSVLANNWDGDRMVLSGKSQTVGDDPYTVWVYCPKGFSVQKVEGAAASGQVVAIDQKAERELVGISFRGGGEAVSWKVQFENGNR